MLLDKLVYDSWSARNVERVDSSTHLMLEIAWRDTKPKPAYIEANSKTLERYRH